MINNLKPDESIDPKKKRLYERFAAEQDRLQSNLAASINFFRDRTDNHRYNYLRWRLNKK